MSVLKSAADAAQDRLWALSVLEAVAVPVLVLDADLRVTEANAAARQLLRAPGRLLGGLPLADLLPEEHARALRDVPGAAVPWRATTTLTTAGAAMQVELYARGRVPGDPAGGVVLTLHPADQAALPGRTSLRQELGEALAGDAVVLHFQPLVRLTDRRPVAAEALVRWDHPQRGLLGAAAVLEAADDPELTTALTERVLAAACHAAAGWERRLPRTAAVRVSVNLSRRQLLAPDTPHLVQAALARTGLLPERLMVEVAEQVLVDHADAALQALTALCTLGVGIALDDLGTGSDAGTYLRRFPLDLVKVDRSLVAGIGGDREATAEVASLVSLAQAMHVRCVAEGVESADQLAVLRNLGCDYGQGYLFSRAMTLPAADEWLERALAVRARGSVPVSATATATVVRAQELQSEGASLHTIAARLNAEGHRNGGRRWHHRTVALLIASNRFPELDL